MTRTVRPRTLRRIASRERQRGYLGLGSYRRLAANALSGPSFAASLLTSIVPDKAAPGTTPTFTRATTKTFTDWEGRVRTAISGEACFTGARRVQNLLTNTGWAGAVANSTAPTGWSRLSAGGTFAPSTSTIDATHQRLDFTVSNNREIMGLTVNLIAGHTYVLSCNVEVVSGTFSDHVMHLVGATATISNGAPLPGANAVAGKRMTTLAPYLCSVSGTATFRVGLGCGATETGNCTISVSRPQLEDVTGQSNQNPGDYVSVGVMSAPFQGANVDGVQYFAAQNGNTLVGNVVTAGSGAPLGLTKQQSAYLPSSNPNWFSTPNAAANTLTGDIDVRWYGTIAWQTLTPGGNLVSKDHSAGGPRVFALQNTGATLGRPRFFYTSDGSTTAGHIADATVAVPFPDNTAGWLRVTYATATGVVTFYTSYDGVSWTQLGATVTITAGTLSAGSTTLTVGAGDGGANNVLPSATIYRAQVYNGINGTLAVDFNPQDYTSGATWASSTTGETWTKNGGASILNNPLLGYSAWQASTNLVLQSENFGTTWALVGTPTRSAAALRCGDVVLDLIGDDDAAAVEGYTQPITFTGDAVKAVSIFFALGSATTSVVDIRDTTAGVTRAWAIITWSGGVPTVTMNAATGTLLGLDALANGVYRARIATTAITAANAHLVRVFPANDAAGTVTLVGNTYFGGVQAENNTFCTPYIATTTAAVTRNVDALGYVLAGNASNTDGTAYAELFKQQVSANEIAVALSDVGGQVLVPTTLTNIAAFDGSLPVTKAGVSDLSTASRKRASAWSSTSLLEKVTGDGLAPASGVFDGTMGAGTGSVFVGCTAAGGTNTFNGNIRNLKIWTRALTDAQLQAMTA